MDDKKKGYFTAILISSAVVAFAVASAVYTLYAEEQHRITGELKARDYAYVLSRDEKGINPPFKIESRIVMMSTSLNDIYGETFLQPYRYRGKDGLEPPKSVKSGCVGEIPLPVDDLE